MNPPARSRMMTATITLSLVMDAMHPSRVPDLTPAADLLDCAAANSVRWEGVQPGIPGLLAPRLRWQWQPTGQEFPASFSTPAEVTPAGLRLALAEQRAAFSEPAPAGFFAAADRT